MNPSFPPVMSVPNMPNMPNMPNNNMMVLKNYPTLYIGDLEEQITEEMLYNFFSKYGIIFSVKVMRNIHNKRSRGFAFLSFYQTKDAENARLNANHERILSNPIRVTWKKAIREVTSEANIFIKNLDNSLTVKDIDGFFGKFGPIFSSKIAIDESSSSFGYGYVQFEDKESAEKCIAEAEKDAQSFKIHENVIEVSRFLSKKNREDPRKNLYIKNLPESEPKEFEIKLKELCEKYGKVTSILIRHDKTNKRSFAFVCYDTKNAANEAFKELQNTDPFGLGEGLYINWAEKKSERAKKLREIYSNTVNETNLFAKNLKEEVTSEELQKAFSSFGEITSCVVKSPTLTPEQQADATFKRTKFGYINFLLKDDAREALSKAREDEAVQPLFEAPGVAVFYHMKKEQFNMYKESKNRVRRMVRFPNMMGEGPNYPYMMPQGPMRGRMPNMPPMNEFFMNQMMMPGVLPKGPFNPKYRRNQGPQGDRKYHQGGRPNGKNQYVKGAQPKPAVQAPQTYKITRQNLKDRLSEFLEFDPEKQRTLLGEILFPSVKDFTTAELAPKVTGMLIDLDVFEVTEILEFLENDEMLKERVKEAEDLINQSNQ